MNANKSDLRRESLKSHQDYEEQKSHHSANNLELMIQIPKTGLTPPETPKSLLPVLKHDISEGKEQQSENDPKVNIDHNNEENKICKIIESYYMETSTVKGKKRRKRQYDKRKTQDIEFHDNIKSQKRRTILMMDSFQNVFTPCYTEDKELMESMGVLVQTQPESDSSCHKKKSNISQSQKLISGDSFVPNLEDEEEIQSYEDDTSENLFISQRSASNEMRICR